MRARIYQPCKYGMYCGQIFDENYKKWKTVTPLCLTKWGAKRELIKWKNMNYPEEIRI